MSAAMIVLGIVGTPASGKSTVAAHLQSKGAAWINADLIARDVLHQQAVTDKLAEHFGSDILGDDGTIQRSKLAALVFGKSAQQQAALDYLESVIHPPTRIEITRQLQAAAKSGAQVALLDVPLLFESAWDRSCDAIWCIDAPREMRLKWSENRGWDAAELDRREVNQTAIAEKRRLSNVILDNDATLSDLLKIVDSQWQILVTMGSIGPDDSAPPHCLTDN
ncbi:MAG: dephospho-CoA kinase [Pirellulaceae bacterium]|nr:dephospho-CoA kinase [Pirellulaceae bacterium]